MIDQQAMLSTLTSPQSIEEHGFSVGAEMAKRAQRVFLSSVLCDGDDPGYQAHYVDHEWVEFLDCVACVNCGAELSLDEVNRS